MRAIEKRLAKLEAVTGKSMVVVSVPHWWPKERQSREADALVRSAGGDPPSLMILLQEFVHEPEGEAELVSMPGWRAP